MTDRSTCFPHWLRSHPMKSHSRGGGGNWGWEGRTSPEQRRLPGASEARWWSQAAWVGMRAPPVTVTMTVTELLHLPVSSVPEPHALIPFTALRPPDGYLPAYLFIFSLFSREEGSCPCLSECHVLTTATRVSGT